MAIPEPHPGLNPAAVYRTEDEQAANAKHRHQTEYRPQHREDSLSVRLKQGDRSRDECNDLHHPQSDDRQARQDNHRVIISQTGRCFHGHTDGHPAHHEHTETG